MAGMMESILPPEAKKSKRESEFKVYINKGEMERICEWVIKKPDIETGGDLFGLWIDASTAVVQFVVGPGKGCRRTATSFFQDTSYLENAGNYFTQQHGLCNIGQWHSHHKIPLFEPSSGDHNTVWSNMPTLDLERYIVFIANIKGSDVTVNSFLFEIKNGQKLPVKKGERVELPGESPLRLNDAVMETVRTGAESLNEKDLVSRRIEGNSSQNETEKTTMVKPNEGIPAENGLCGTPSIGDKDTTVSVTTSAPKSNETESTPEKPFTAILPPRKSNSSKTNAQTPSNEKQPNKPQQPVTVEKQPIKPSVTLFHEPAPLKDRKKQETETEHDKSVLHGSNNTSSNNDTTTTTKGEKENHVNKNKNSSISGNKNNQNSKNSNNDDKDNNNSSKTTNNNDNNSNKESEDSNNDDKDNNNSSNDASRQNDTTTTNNDNNSNKESENSNNEDKDNSSNNASRQNDTTITTATTTTTNDNNNDNNSSKESENSNNDDKDNSSNNASRQNESTTTTNNDNKNNIKESENSNNDDKDNSSNNASRQNESTTTNNNDNKNNIKESENSNNDDKDNTNTTNNNNSKQNDCNSTTPNTNTTGNNNNTESNTDNNTESVVTEKPGESPQEKREMDNNENSGSYWCCFM